jgi:hypothetical protein
MCARARARARMHAMPMYVPRRPSPP